MRRVWLIRKMFKFRISSSCMNRISGGIKLTRKSKRKRKNIRRLKADPNLISEAMINLVLN
jgi:hypothetical protein